MIEFAVIAPIMFLFVFGIIEFSRVVMVQQSMTSAARKGCREATLVVTASSTDVDTTVRNAMQSVTANAFDPLKVRVTVSPSTLANLASGTPITVDVEVDVADVSWLPGSFAGFTSASTLTAEASQERE